MVDVLAHIAAGLTPAQLAATARTDEERLLSVAAALIRGGDAQRGDEVRNAVLALRIVRRRYEQMCSSTTDALRDLVHRADTSEMADGSSLDTAHAHAVLDVD
jgi:hypothetical protein